MEPSLKSRPDAEIKRFIESSPMVTCFCCYGAIKNLQFFEACLHVKLQLHNPYRLQSGQCLSSAPVPPQGEPGGSSRQLVTPRKQPGRGRPSTRGAHSHCLGRSYESEPPPNPPILTAPPSTMHSGIPAAHPDGVGLLPLPG